MIRYPAGHLFGTWADAVPAKSHQRPAAGRSPAQRPKPVTAEKSSQAKRGSAAKAKPKTIRRGGDRHTHAVETARGILIGRVDALLPQIERILLEEAAEHVEDAEACLTIAIRCVQSLQVALFPEEFADEPADSPDPAKRKSVPAGLIPKVFTQAAEYAAHLERGKKSPAAKLVGEGGKPVLSDAELARLGERQARRGAGAGR